jgi:thiol-disulfide isomerase/thioredoxin
MRLTFRAGLGTAALVILAILFPAGEARAGEDLNVQDWLSRGGVRLVAVEFYATWCKPCMEAMPRWRQLKEKFGPQGLRVIVVNTQDPDGACRALPVVPDETVCDLNGNVADAFKLQGKLPSAYLWSWQGNLLVAKGHIDEVEKAVADYLRDAPRVVVEGGEGVGADVVAAMRDRLTEEGKVLVLAGKEEQAAIDAAKRAAQGARYDEKLACEIGKEIPPNALLKVSRVSQGKASYLNASLLDLAGGCLLSSASSEWSSDLRRMTQDTSTKLLAKLRRPGGVQSPVGAMPPPAERAKRQDKIVNPEDAKWRPTSVDPVMVSLESQPSGARVEMDGATLCAATPCRKMVDPGLHAFRMSADKFVTKEERVRVDGDEQKLAWKLEANTAVVTVDTGAVSGVPIVVDGEAAGKSPLRLDLGAGPHRIEIKDACYEPARADVSVERGVAKRVELNGVQKTAGLRVELSDAKDEPVQGDVKLDGVVVGRTWKTLTVPACGKSVDVESNGQKWREQVALVAYEKTTVAGRLVALGKPAIEQPSEPNSGQSNSAKWKWALYPGLIGGGLALGFVVNSVVGTTKPVVAPIFPVTLGAAGIVAAYAIDLSF